jgi:hypothetical protein
MVAISESEIITGVRTLVEFGTGAIGDRYLWRFLKEQVWGF